MICNFSTLIPEHTSDQQIAIIADLPEELSVAFDAYYYVQLARYHKSKNSN